MVKSYKEMENSLEVQSELIQKNQKLEKVSLVFNFLEILK